MTRPNRIFVAAAGSGKTTFLVREALKIQNESVLITTYTESNEAEIRRKIFELNGHIPTNIVVMTWFSFLIAHGVKPFQGGLFKFQVRGMLLVSQRSGLRYRSARGHPVYWSEEEFERHYFDGGHNLFSDKLSKLVIRCNDNSGGAVFDRISRVFQNVFVDEVQDLAGYDLDILVEIIRGPAGVTLVGDPRQVTYLTHNEARHSKYDEGGIVAFLQEKLPKRSTIDIDEDTLSVSHRNNAAICDISSKLYPTMKAVSACACVSCRTTKPDEEGLFIVRADNVQRYMETHRPMQLRDRATTSGVHNGFPVMNFGESKGLGFERVIIHPTAPMISWLRNQNTDLKPRTRARFYVALTRARHSVAVICDLRDDEIPTGFTAYS